VHFIKSSLVGGNKAGDNWESRSFGINASRSNGVYGRRNEVAPKNYAVYYYIKY